MWKRFLDTLRCPCCQDSLELVIIEDHNITLKSEDYAKAEILGIQCNKLNEYVESGILLCANCRHWYPIMYGLPVLHPYKTLITYEFIKKHKSFVNRFSDKYATPKGTPKPGEQFVLRSFSKEWKEYEYDGVIWGWSYKDREKTFLTEMGFADVRLVRQGIVQFGILNFSLCQHK